MQNIRDLPDMPPDTPPSEPGYYAGCHCWDSNEGAFPDGYYWNGKEWADDLPIVFYKPFRFGTREEAEAAAEKADLGW